jgi:hypothetical protein
MGRLVFCIMALLAAAPVTAHAQFVSVPPPPGYAMNPPADSPLQQQILRNYRSDLLQTQRDLALQNPSGLSRDQLDVARQLNTVNSALIPASPSPTITAPTVRAPATITPVTPLGALAPVR